MDITQLAQMVTAFLAPFLPYLVGKAGDAVAEVTVEKSVEASWERAKTLWGKLRPKVESKPAAREAAQDLVQAPDDEDAQAALRLQVKKLLREDSILAEEVGQLWQEAESAGVTVIASGERAVAIGRDLKGGTIITGDGTSSQAIKGEYETD